MEQELEGIQKTYDLVMEFMVNYSFQVVGAFIILILGYFAAVFISRSIDKLCAKRDVDVTLRKFIVSVVKILVLACFLIISLGKFGISIAPFLAALGAATAGVYTGNLLVTINPI